MEVAGERFMRGDEMHNDEEIGRLTNSWIETEL